MSHISHFFCHWDLVIGNLCVQSNTMKQLPLLITTLLLASCVSAEGISPESSREPRGNPLSSIVLEEFSDLQCPACQRTHETTVLPLLDKYKNTIRYEFRHFPIRTIHAFAQEAAEATECAADQGKFWEFIDDTYASPENQSDLSREALIERAKAIRVSDIDLFSRCLRSRVKRDIVQDDYDEGIERGIQGTPTFFVAGERVGRNTLDVMQQMIQEKIGQQRL